jgi:hypothetical protein
MSSTASKRIVIGLIVAAVIAVWATTQLHGTTHYSNVPGEGAGLQRMVLPPLDASAGGPVALPDAGSGTAAVHYPAQQAAVDPPPAAPAAVAATRVPDATPQDPQVVHRTTTGSAVHDPMPGTPSFDASIITNQLPICDAACVQRVLANLGAGIPLPPVVPPVVPTP